MKPRVLWYCGGLYQEGGGERLLLEGVQHLKNTGHETALFVDHVHLSADSIFGGQYDIEVISVPAAEALNLGFLNRFFWLKRILVFLKRAQAVKNYKPDLIFSIYPSAALEVRLIRILTGKRIPYSCYMHDNSFQTTEDLEKYARPYRKVFDQIWEADPTYRAYIPRKWRLSWKSQLQLDLGAFLRRWGVQGADVVFVLSEKAKKEAKMLYGTSRVHANMGAFPASLFDYRPLQDMKKRHGVGGKRIFFSLCRLVVKKHVDLIIRAFAAYLAKHPEVRENSRLWIGGRGPEFESLKKLARELSVDQQIEFLGFIKEEDLFDYYCSSDVFVTADNADFDITSWMALAFGKVVVSPEQHEFPDSVLRTGFICRGRETADDFSEVYHQAVQFSSGRPETDELLNVMRAYTWSNYFDRNLETALKAASRPRST